MRRRSNDSFWMWGVAVVAVLIVAGIALYYGQRERGFTPDEPVAALPEPAATPPPARTPAEPQADTGERALPLPPLDESDADVQSGLTELVGNDAVAEFLVPERIVRNLVVTIDNLPREQATVQQRPIKPTPGAFMTEGTEDAPVLSPDNYERYEPFISIVENVDAKTLVSMYRGLQPLFQQAYEDLGHPNAFFTTRLLEVIDHLLQTPTPSGAIRLVQPSVQYRYADERLEKLSAGQKLLLRMGPENAEAIKTKLREIQAELS